VSKNAAKAASLRAAVVQDSEIARTRTTCTLREAAHREARLRTGSEQNATSAVRLAGDASVSDDALFEQRFAVDQVKLTTTQRPTPNAEAAITRPSLVKFCTCRSLPT
jgi:hypothetical protein